MGVIGHGRTVTGSPTGEHEERLVWLARSLGLRFGLGFGFGFGLGFGLGFGFRFGFGLRDRVRVES